MDKNLLYLEEKDYIARAVYLNEIISIYSIKCEINRLAGEHFINIPAYYHEVRKRTNLKNKIPLFFSPQLFLFTFCSYDGKRFSINYFALKGICFDDDLIFVFKCGYLLRVKASYLVLQKEIKKVKQILNHLSTMYALS